MLTSFDSRTLDRAKQITFDQVAMEERVTEAMKTTMWFLVERALYFANKQKDHVDFEENTAIAAVAKQSREAQQKYGKGGGIQGFLMTLAEKKDKNLPVVFDQKSIRRAENLLEKMGVFIAERAGKGKTPKLHINLRVAVLFLEWAHPKLWAIEKHLGNYSGWLKDFCGKVLKRPFNRKDKEWGDLYNGNYFAEDTAIFEELYPPKKFDLSKLTAIARQIFHKFCEKAKALELGCIYWLPDISNPPDWSEYA